MSIFSDIFATGYVTALSAVTMMFIFEAHAGWLAAKDRGKGGRRIWLLLGPVGALLCLRTLIEFLKSHPMGG